MAGSVEHRNGWMLARVRWGCWRQDGSGECRTGVVRMGRLWRDWMVERSIGFLLEKLLGGPTS
jgi:hypothetical protein